MSLKTNSNAFLAHPHSVVMLIQTVWYKNHWYSVIDSFIYAIETSVTNEKSGFIMSCKKREGNGSLNMVEAVAPPPKKKKNIQLYLKEKKNDICEHVNFRTISWKINSLPMTA